MHEHFRAEIVNPEEAILNDSDDLRIETDWNRLKHQVTNTATFTCEKSCEKSCSIQVWLFPPFFALSFSTLNMTQHSGGLQTCSAVDSSTRTSLMKFEPSGGFQKWVPHGTPIAGWCWMVYSGRSDQNPIKMDETGYPPISGNLEIWLKADCFWAFAEWRADRAFQSFVQKRFFAFHISQDFQALAVCTVKVEWFQYIPIYGYGSIPIDTIF